MAEATVATKAKGTGGLAVEGTALAIADVATAAAAPAATTTDDEITELAPAAGTWEEWLKWRGELRSVDSSYSLGSNFRFFGTRRATTADSCCCCC